MPTLDRLDEEPPCTSDDWPHTKRVLPWALAGFMVMLFLVPFDAIDLPINLPLNSSLDRPLLVALATLWLLSLAIISGEARPRLKLTRVHFAVLAFFALCCLGVALDGHALASMDEVSLVVKKLALLASYIVFFFVVASVIRPREVPRYAALMVGLGVIVAIATIVEYRLHYNVFYSLWGKVLPITVPDRTRHAGLDRAPHGLRADQPAAGARGAAGDGAAVRGDRLDRRRHAPPAGALHDRDRTAARGRRRNLTQDEPRGARGGDPAAGRLPPARGVPLAARALAVVLGVLVHFTSPGALGSVLTQLEPGHFNNALTTTDRTARYDAVRPDVLSHLLLGRGYESYDPHMYRILDNEYLGLLITTGLLGLLALPGHLRRDDERRAPHDSRPRPRALLARARRLRLGRGDRARERALRRPLLPACALPAVLRRGDDRDAARALASARAGAARCLPSQPVPARGRRSAVRPDPGRRPSLPAPAGPGTCTATRSCTATPSCAQPERVSGPCRLRLIVSPHRWSERCPSSQIPAKVAAEPVRLLIRCSRIRSCEHAVWRGPASPARRAPRQLRLLMCGMRPRVAAAVTCPNANPIVNENNCMGEGTTDNESAIENYSEDIGGFTTQTSYQLGENVPLKIGTDLPSFPSTNVNIAVYRIGYYGGDGARLIPTAGASNVKVNNTFQCNPMNPTTGELSCSNWSVTYTIPGNKLPISGIYEAVFTDVADGGIQNYVVFTVRNDARASEILVRAAQRRPTRPTTRGAASRCTSTRAAAQTRSRATGARSRSPSTARWTKATPSATTSSGPTTTPSSVARAAGLRRHLHRRHPDRLRTPRSLLNHKVDLVSGHSEYWSHGSFNNFKAARDAGVNIALAERQHRLLADALRKQPPHAGLLQDDPGLRQRQPRRRRPTTRPRSGPDGERDDRQFATTTRRDPGAPAGDPNAPPGGRIGPNEPEN